jgi:hypothetical protein
MAPINNNGFCDPRCCENADGFLGFGAVIFLIGCSGAVLHVLLATSAQWHRMLVYVAAAINSATCFVARVLLMYVLINTV